MPRIENYSMTASLWKTGAERPNSLATGSRIEGGVQAGGGRLQHEVRGPAPVSES